MLQQPQKGMLVVAHDGDGAGRALWQAHVWMNGGCLCVHIYIYTYIHTYMYTYIVYYAPERPAFMGWCRWHALSGSSLGPAGAGLEGEGARITMMMMRTMMMISMMMMMLRTMMTTMIMTTMIFNVDRVRGP